MPLLKIEWSGPTNAWAIWRVTEAAPMLAEAVWPEVCPADILHPLKRTEWLAGRLLVKHLVKEAGLAYRGISKNPFGKPGLVDLSQVLSLSHSYPYVAAQIGSYETVGIDIEQPKEKLLRIAHRVFSESEQADAGTDLIKNCVYWCAKEALYKIYGKRGLIFSQHLLIDPFTLSTKGVLSAHINIENNDQSFSLGYETAQDFVLVYTQR